MESKGLWNHHALSDNQSCAEIDEGYFFVVLSDHPVSPVQVSVANTLLVVQVLDSTRHLDHPIKSDVFWKAFRESLGGSLVECLPFQELKNKCTSGLTFSVAVDVLDNLRVIAQAQSVFLCLEQLCKVRVFELFF